MAELVEDVAEIRDMLMMTSFSGPIPEAPDLYKYTEAHQERIFRIAEARTSDESARQDRQSARLDRITDAQIQQSHRSQWITPSLLVGFGATGAYFFGVGMPWAGGAFLAMPVIRFLGTFVSTFAIRKDRSDEPGADED